MGFDKFFHRLEAWPERYIVWPVEKLAAGVLDCKTTDQHAELIGVLPTEFRLDITVRQQHGVDNERVVELCGTALESED